MKKQMNFIEMGEYYGYPPCCIAEFLEFVLFGYKNGTYPDREDRKLNGSGYVPCIECSKKTEAELLITIAVNRKCETT